MLGSFDHRSNPKNEEFAIGKIYGQDLIIEYNNPQPHSEDFILSSIGHLYRHSLDPVINGFNNSDPCQVNVNCAEGNSWQDEKRGVAKILLKIGADYYYCTGSLVNNARQDCTNYFLSAFHCGEGASTADLNQWIFDFNYEAPGCSNPTPEPTPHTLTGATLVASSDDGHNSSGSDFLLLNLNDQQIPTGYNAYFNGWSNINVSSNAGVGIHHPSGDIKKISTYASPLISSTWSGTLDTHWQVSWSATANGHGVTEGGSSGSPIFNASGQIVGTLTGGTSFCTDPTDPDWYGKMSYHWQSNGSTAATRLKDWLDPDNNGISTLTGRENGCAALPPCNGTNGNLTGIITTGSYIYSNSISSDGMIPVSNDVLFQAGTSIELHPDFAVNVGVSDTNAHFQAAQRLRPLVENVAATHVL